MIPMLDGVQRQRLRATFTRLELAFIGVALACLAGQFARLPRIAPGHGCSGCRDRPWRRVFGFSFAMLASIMRRARAQVRGTAG